MIVQSDILEWAERYDGEPFHAAFMDAPYHLAEITRRFGKSDSAQAQYGTDGAFQRASKGFMGKQWDGGDIAFRPETWDAIARHLYPGGWIVSFGGSRTWHRMACAMEDAGLIIQPTMFLWAYGSGFPKATRPDAHIDARAFRTWLADHPEERELLALMKRAGKRDPIDKKAAQGYERELKQRAGLAPEIVGQKKHAPKFDAAGHGYREKDNGYNSKDRESFDLTEPATALARDWAGHRYGGQAIKPAVEPIIFAQKPYDGPPVESMTRTGAGALWIEGARIGTAEDMNPRDFDDSRRTTPKFDHIYKSTAPLRSSSGAVPNGRWPANLVLSHLPDCNGNCAPGCPVAALGAQSGESEARRSIRRKAGSHIGLLQGDDSWQFRYDNEGGHDDTGTAARFFYNADWQYERLEQADPVGYFAKASKGEREAGLDDMQVRLMRDLYGVDDDFEEFDDAVDGHAVYGDYAGTPEHGSNMGSRRFDTATINDGRPTPIDNPYQRGETKRKNIHPTVKPIALNRWLATLLLPPARYAPRRLLVPFAGVASEYIGAMLAGWEAIVGVELEAQHVRIAQARIAYWQQMRYRLMNPDTPIKLRPGAKVPDGQLELF